MTEVGVDFRAGPPTAEQLAQVRKLLVERGVLPAPGEATVTTRTVYRLPGGDKSATPEAVSVKIGITDGVNSEVVGGLAEGDVIITGVSGGSPAGSAPQQPVNNPFGGGRRF